MEQEFGSLVVKFNNELAEMERIVSTIRRRGFKLVSMQVSNTDVDGQMIAMAVLRDLPEGNKSLQALKSQLDKHIDVLSVEASTVFANSNALNKVIDRFQSLQTAL